MSPLTVSDIERLAKAGVTIKFDDIMHQVIQDELLPMAPPVPQYPSSLDEAFWQRWHRAHIGNDFNRYGEPRPYEIHATEYGDKAYLFVQPLGAPPFILEDERSLFPSDALMTKLHLWQQTNGGKK